MCLLRRPRRRYRARGTQRRSCQALLESARVCSSPSVRVSSAQPSTPSLPPKHRRVPRQTDQTALHWMQRGNGMPGKRGEPSTPFSGMRAGSTRRLTDSRECSGAKPFRHGLAARSRQALQDMAEGPRLGTPLGRAGGSGEWSISAAFCPLTVPWAALRSSSWWLTSSAKSRRRPACNHPVTNQRTPQPVARIIMSPHICTAANSVFCP